ncbi:MAG: hypothetical protein WC242_00135 [Candidatus Paceibacterota bacterium]|jgi:hypothetical protein
MNLEKHQPLPDEIKKAEDFLTDEQKEMSEEREKSFLIPDSINFDNNRNTLLIGINRDMIDFGILSELANENGLEVKDKFHITVLGFKNGSEIKKVLKALPEEEKQSILLQIKSLASSTDWSFVLEPKRYHISKEYTTPDPRDKSVELKERRESYIQMVHLPGMRIFYEKLNTILGTNLEAPPAHITLYTGGNDREKSKMGIGINSQEEFLKLNPELIQL